MANKVSFFSDSENYSRYISIYKVTKLVNDLEVLYSSKNRLQDESHVNRLADNFKIEFCQPLTVLARNVDGKVQFTILDGQHRFSALRKIYSDKNHPLNSEIDKWEVALDIHQPKESSTVNFTDLLKAFNEKRDFKAEQINTAKFDEVIRLVNKELRFKNSSLPLIKPRTHAPHISEEKFTNMLHTSSYFNNPQVSAKQVAEKIILINEFLIKHMNPRTKEFWHSKSASRIPACLGKCYESRVALGINSDLSWSPLLDLDPISWTKI